MKTRLVIDHRFLKVLIICCVSTFTIGVKATQLNVNIAYLQLTGPDKPVLSNILPEPADSGLRGAELGIEDSNTTGKFLKHNYILKPFVSTDFEEIKRTVTRWLNENETFLYVLDMPAKELVELSKILAGYNTLAFNAGSRENSLRTDACLPGMLHTVPSDAMLADALGQWLIFRQWKRWLLIVGNEPADLAFAQSVQRTAKRYGAKIVAEKQWTFDTDLRRTAQSEMPLFTQTPEYDVVIVADVAGDFGEYVLYNTWYPRPVAGSQGLTPVAWHRVVEQWGAAQLQSRFESLAGRWMNSADYSAWAAVRSIAEAVTKTQTIAADKILDFINSDNFQLAAFKGRKLSYRPWSGQLRQPIPLVHPRSLVAQAPMEGFLHPLTDLDTLGFDQPESHCAG